jgi:F420-dependent oxidoreductase-like protein
MIKIGTFLEMTTSVADAVAQAQRIVDAGFTSAWATQIFGVDALTELAVIGSLVPEIELGTSVIPVYARHPQVMAQQALTIQSASHNRLTLGIGLSHQVVVESLWGYSYEKPARYMREYLQALIPMLNGEASMVTGDVITAITAGPLEIPDVEAPAVLVAALAPTMLKLAGSVADGTVTWMTGISTIASHIAPKIKEAASEAGRPSPQIVVSLPVCLTEDVAAAKESIDAAFSIYPNLPSYRAMLDIEGAQSASDIALVGSREQIIDGIGRLEEAGGTLLAAGPSGNRGEREATFEFLGELSKS